MKNIEISKVYNALKTLPLVKLNGKIIGEIFNVLDELKRTDEIYQKQREAILAEYGIDSNSEDAQIKYANHEKISEITQRVSKLDNEDAAVVGRPVMTKDQLFECVAAATNGNMAMAEVLVSLIAA